MFEFFLGDSARRLQLLAKVLCVVGMVLAAGILLIGLASTRFASEVLDMLGMRKYDSDVVMVLVVVLLAFLAFAACWVAAIRCYAWGRAAGGDRDEGKFAILLGNCAGKLESLSDLESVLSILVPTVVVVLGIGAGLEVGAGIVAIGGSFGDSFRVNTAGVMISILLAAAMFFILWVSALQDRAWSDAVRGTVNPRKGLLGHSGSKLQVLAMVIAALGLMAVVMGVCLGGLQIFMEFGDGKADALVVLACTLLVAAICWVSAIVLFACGTAGYGEERVGVFKMLLGDVEDKLEWIAKILVVLTIVGGTIGGIAALIGAVIQLFTDGFGAFAGRLIGTAALILSLWNFAMICQAWSACAKRVNSRKCLVCGTINEDIKGPCAQCGACLLCGTSMEPDAAQCPGCGVSCRTKT